MLAKENKSQFCCCLTGFLWIDWFFPGAHLKADLRWCSSRRSFPHVRMGTCKFCVKSGHSPEKCSMERLKDNEWQQSSTNVRLTVKHILPYSSKLSVCFLHVGMSQLPHFLLLSTWSPLLSVCVEHQKFSSGFLPTPKNLVQEWKTLPLNLNGNLHSSGCGDPPFNKIKQILWSFCHNWIETIFHYFKYRIYATVWQSEPDR